MCLSPSFSFLHQKMNALGLRLDLRLFRFRLDSSLSEFPGSLAVLTPSAQSASVSDLPVGTEPSSEKLMSLEASEMAHDDTSPTYPNPIWSAACCAAGFSVAPGQGEGSGCAMASSWTFLKRWRLASTMPLICSPTCEQHQCTLARAGLSQAWPLSSCPR